MSAKTDMGDLPSRPGGTPERNGLILMAKFYARGTRDFTRTISMGSLIATGFLTGNVAEIAPARVHVLVTKAGDISQFRTKKLRDAYIAACNAESPGSVETEEDYLYRELTRRNA